MNQPSVSGLILSNNEEVNIGRTLSRLSWLPEIVLLDSNSNDKTLEIARSFPNVRICQREFDNHHNQWNYGLKDCGLTSEWVLALDSDYQFDEQICAEIQATIESNPSENAFRANFKYAINGEVLKSGIYTPVQVLFRREYAIYVDEGHTQRVKVDGSSGWLQNNVIHDDRKPFARWILSQLRYSKLEAEKILHTPKDKLSKTNRLRKTTIFTPIIVFFYCLLVRKGIFEGKNAILYAFQRLLAESLIQYKLKDR